MASQYGDLTSPPPSLPPSHSLKGHHLWKDSPDQATHRCRTCKTLQCAECGDGGCTRCPAGSFMANATMHGVDYKQCIPCSEVYPLRNCASCGQHK